MGKKRVLFLCVNNSARSQMAEGLISHDLGDRFEAFSAGDHPTGVRPQAVEVMAELGIDITSQRSKSVSEFDNQDFDWVISLCSGSAGGCPLFIGAGERVHIEFDDPAEAQGSEEEVLAVYRRVRDAIRDRVESFLLKKEGLQE
jgi:arsenate reductase